MVIKYICMQVRFNQKINNLQIFSYQRDFKFCPWSHLSPFTLLKAVNAVYHFPREQDLELIFYFLVVLKLIDIDIIFFDLWTDVNHIYSQLVHEKLAVHKSKIGFSWLFYAFKRACWMTWRVICESPQRKQTFRRVYFDELHMLIDILSFVPRMHGCCSE